MSDFQKQYELNLMKKNKSEIEVALLRFINSRNIKKACDSMQEALYNDKLSFCLSTYEYNYYVKFTQAKNIKHHFKIRITDDLPGTLYEIDFFAVPDGGQNANGFPTYKLVTDSEYVILTKKAELLQSSDPVAENYKAARQECFDYIDKIKNDLKSDPDPRKRIDYLLNLEKYLRKSIKMPSSDFINIIKARNDEELIDLIVVPFNYNADSITIFKIAYIMKIKSAFKDKAITDVRVSLLKQLADEGIEKIVEGVEVDSSIDFSDNYSKTALKYGTKSYEDLIRNGFKNETSYKKLEKSLLQLLKLYYDFNNITERNAKRLAEFLLANNLTESEFLVSLVKTENPEVIKTTWYIIDILDGFKHGIKDVYKKHRHLAPDKYRFKKTVKLMNVRYGSKLLDNGKYEKLETTAKYDAKLLDKMRNVAAQFNEANDKPENTEILEINFGKNDGEFIFEFITYKEGDKEPDGRRLGEFTAMFNRSLPDIGTIYLDYQN